MANMDSGFGQGQGGANVQKTRIVIADEHFLYLPLYFARHKNFFGLLPRGTQITIERSASYTDKSAFEMLMNEHNPSYSDVDFAVCDPATLIFQTPANTYPVVLAGLVTNSAFWVVNHKANLGPRLDSYATFKEIIAFKKGTTSFGIASRIFHGPEKSKSIVTVNPKEELNLLVDSGPTTIALSPDILRIHKLLETKGDVFGIELALADTTEYHGMLVTALLTRRDVLDRKPELARALLQALQIALDAVRDRTDEVVSYAAGRFEEGRHTVEGAMREAERAAVYPAEIRVTQPNWTKLAETAFRSLGHQFDAAAQEKARVCYLTAVEPYEIWASEAVKATKNRSTTTADSPAPAGSENRRGLLGTKQPKPAMLASEPASATLTLWKRASPWLAALLPCLVVIAVYFAYTRLVPVALPWYTAASLAATVVVAVICASFGRIVPWSLAGTVFWLPMLGTFLIVIALGNLEGARKFSKDFVGLDADQVLTSINLILTMIATWVAEIQYVEGLRRKRTERQDGAWA
jgi:hypothetical protein